MSAKKKKQASKNVETAKQVFTSEGVSQRVNILRAKGQYMVDMKIPFKLVRSGNAFDLISTLYNQKAQRNMMDSNDMNFIKRVKMEVSKGDKLMQYADVDYCNETIEYMKVNDNYRVGDKVEDLLYIDINSAYWSTAYLLGIISQETYKKGLEKSKVVRLASLGSLAKRKEVWNFDGNEFYRESTSRSWETENIWFLICKTIADLMCGVAESLGDDFVFYWVDGIYVKNTSENLMKVTEAFLKSGYTCKSEIASSIEFRDYDFEVTGFMSSDKKVFSYSVSDKGKQVKAMLRDIQQRSKVKDTVLRALRGEFDNL